MLGVTYMIHYRAGIKAQIQKSLQIFIVINNHSKYHYNKYSSK